MASTDPNGHDTAILNSNSCKNLDTTGGTGIVDPAGCLYFNIKLDECSTQVNAVSDPNNPDDPALNYIEFTQQLSSEITDVYQQEPNSPSVNLGNTLDSQFLALISNAPRVSIDFKCRYTQEYTTDSSAVATSPDDVTENLVSTGRFAYSLDTVQPVDMTGEDNHNLDQVATWRPIHSTDSDDADAAYNVGNTLYFKICAQQDLSNIMFSVPDCTVSQPATGESYKIIDDHCPDQFVDTAREGRWHHGFFTTWAGNELPLPTGQKADLDVYDPTNLATDECLLFSYTVFEFISSAGSNNDLKLSCNVKACDYSETNPDNMEPCLIHDASSCSSGLGGRKKRSTQFKNEQYVTISQTIKVNPTENL